MDIKSFVPDIDVLQIILVIVATGFTGLAIYLKDLSSLKAVLMALIGLYAYHKGSQAPPPALNGK